MQINLIHIFANRNQRFSKIYNYIKLLKHSIIEVSPDVMSGLSFLADANILVKNFVIANE